MRICVMSFEPVDIEPGQVFNMTVQLSVLFKPCRLVVPVKVRWDLVRTLRPKGWRPVRMPYGPSANVLVENIMVGNQLTLQGEVPSTLFGGELEPLYLDMPTTHMGQLITLRVRNAGDQKVIGFRAAIFGHTP